MNNSFGPSRLALGTVQFGLPYGISNNKGKVTEAQAHEMINLARNANVNTLDTAVAYGEAEEVLGRIGVSDFFIISKLPRFDQTEKFLDGWVLNKIQDSLIRLDVPSLYGLMLHAPDDLLGPYGAKIVRELLHAKTMGLVERIGLSVYSPEQLASLVNILPIEIIQIPLNIFDRRFYETGWLDKLVLSGIEVHVRSVFLQGLLLMHRKNIPSKFAPFREKINDWHTWLDSQSFRKSPVEACLAHVSSYNGISRIVVGADNPVHLQEIITASDSVACRAPESLSSCDTSLINPAEWNAL